MQVVVLKKLFALAFISLLLFGCVQISQDQPLKEQSTNGESVSPQPSKNIEPTPELSKQAAIEPTAGEQQATPEPSKQASEETGIDKEVVGVGMAPPWYAHCTGLGYLLDDEGNCVFPDGTKCEILDFFNGNCGQKFSYCEKQGYKLENRIENTSAGWTATYPVCVFDDGSECPEDKGLDSSCSRSQCKKWTMSEGCKN